MFLVNEDELIDIVEPLFKEIVKQFDLMRFYQDRSFYPETELERMRSLVNTHNLNLDVDGLIEELERNSDRQIVTSFINNRAVLGFLLWIHEAKLWLYSDAHKEFEFEYFGVNKNRLFYDLPASITVWHNKNIIKCQLQLKEENSFPAVISLREIEPVAIVDTCSLEKAWLLTQNSDKPWYQTESKRQRST